MQNPSYHGVMVFSMAINETSLLVLEEALREAIRDLVDVAPRILLALIAVSIIAIIGIILVRFTRRLLSLFRVDELLKPIEERYQVPFTLSGLIVTLIGIGIGMIAVYTAAYIVSPSILPLIDQAVDVVGRIISVVLMIIIVSTALAVAFDKMRVETRLRGFMMLLTMLISLVLIIDISALSNELKQAIAWGLSLGIGLSIGVFTAWYFFGEAIQAHRPRRGKQES